MRTSATTDRRLAPAAALAAAALLLGGCAATTPPAGEDKAAEQTRTVEHARGEATVAAEPARVVTLEPVALDSAVALGVSPVGAAAAADVDGVPEYLGVDGVETVGTIVEPNLEAIAALEPDLILGTDARHSDLFEQLDAIAPTVFLADQTAPWQESLDLVASALGREDQAVELVDAYDERCDEIAASAGTDGATANVVRPRDGDLLRLHSGDTFAGAALECAGLTIPDQDWAGETTIEVSAENATLAAADHVLVATTDVNDASTVPAALARVEDRIGDVTLVDTSVWIAGVGPLGAQRVLDDIERVLGAED